MEFRKIAAGKLLFLALFCLAGCEPIMESAGSAEQPPAKIPKELRQQNWPNAQGSGSCVIASTCSAVNWAGQYELSKWLRSNYAGGQTARSIQQKLTDAKVPFIATENTDIGVLEYATRTRRPAIVWFFPSHCVTFCGFGIDYSGRKVAWLLDNNRTSDFIPIPLDQFLRDWHDYGGFALVPMFSPAPPLPW